MKISRIQLAIFGGVVYVMEGVHVTNGSLAEGGPTGNFVDAEAQGPLNPWWSHGDISKPYKQQIQLSHGDKIGI